MSRKGIGGGPTKAITNRVAELVRQGVHPVTAATSLGYGAATIGYWLAVGEGRDRKNNKIHTAAYILSCEEFVYAIRTAENEAKAEAEKAVHKAGVGFNKVVKKTVTKISEEKGVEEVTSITTTREFDWRAAERYLRVKSKEWRDTGEQKVEVTVESGEKAAELMRGVNLFKGSSPEDEIDNI
jgi:hypothetical protein